jgi:hypothetical protein
VSEDLAKLKSRGPDSAGFDYVQTRKQVDTDVETGLPAKKSEKSGIRRRPGKSTGETRGDDLSMSEDEDLETWSLHLLQEDDLHAKVERFLSSEVLTLGKLFQIPSLREDASSTKRPGGGLGSSQLDRTGGSPRPLKEKADIISLQPFKEKTDVISQPMKEPFDKDLAVFRTIALKTGHDKKEVVTKDKDKESKRPADHPQTRRLGDMDAKAQQSASLLSGKPQYQPQQSARLLSGKPQYQPQQSARLLSGKPQYQPHYDYEKPSQVEDELPQTRRLGDMDATAQQPASGKPKYQPHYEKPSQVEDELPQTIRLGDVDAKTQQPARLLSVKPQYQPHYEKPSQLEDELPEKPATFDPLFNAEDITVAPLPEDANLTARLGPSQLQKKTGVFQLHPFGSALSVVGMQMDHGMTSDKTEDMAKLRSKGPASVGFDFEKAGKHGDRDVEKGPQVWHYSRKSKGDTHRNDLEFLERLQEDDLSDKVGRFLHVDEGPMIIRRLETPKAPLPEDANLTTRLQAGRGPSQRIVKDPFAVVGTTVKTDLGMTSDVQEDWAKLGPKGPASIDNLQSRKAERELPVKFLTFGSLLDSVEKTKILLPEDASLANKGVKPGRGRPRLTSKAGVVTKRFKGPFDSVLSILGTSIKMRSDRSHFQVQNVWELRRPFTPEDKNLQMQRTEQPSPEHPVTAPLTPQKESSAHTSLPDPQQFAVPKQLASKSGIQVVQAQPIVIRGYTTRSGSPPRPADSRLDRAQVRGLTLDNFALDAVRTAQPVVSRGLSPRKNTLKTPTFEPTLPETSTDQFHAPNIPYKVMMFKTTRALSPHSGDIQTRYPPSSASVSSRPATSEISFSSPQTFTSSDAARSLITTQFSLQPREVTIRSALSPISFPSSKATKDTASSPATISSEQPMQTYPKEQVKVITTEIPDQRPASQTNMFSQEPTESIASSLCSDSFKEPSKSSELPSSGFKEPAMNVPTTPRKLSLKETIGSLQPTSALSGKEPRKTVSAIRTGSSSGERARKLSSPASLTSREPKKTGVILPATPPATQPKKGILITRASISPRQRKGSPSPPGKLAEPRESASIFSSEERSFVVRRQVTIDESSKEVHIMASRRSSQEMRVEEREAVSPVFYYHDKDFLKEMQRVRSGRAALREPERPSTSSSGGQRGSSHSTELQSTQSGEGQRSQKQQISPLPPPHFYNKDMLFLETYPEDFVTSPQTEETVRSSRTSSGWTDDWSRGRADDWRRQNRTPTQSSFDFFGGRSLFESYDSHMSQPDSYSTLERQVTEEDAIREMWGLQRRSVPQRSLSATSDSIFVQTPPLKVDSEQVDSKDRLAIKFDDMPCFSDPDLFPSLSDSDLPTSWQDEKIYATLCSKYPRTELEKKAAADVKAVQSLLNKVANQKQNEVKPRKELLRPRSALCKGRKKPAPRFKGFRFTKKFQKRGDSSGTKHTYKTFLSESAESLFSLTSSGVSSPGPSKSKDVEEEETLEERAPKDRKSPKAISMLFPSPDLLDSGAKPARWEVDERPVRLCYLDNQSTTRYTPQWREQQRKKELQSKHLTDKNTEQEERLTDQSAGQSKTLRKPVSPQADTDNKQRDEDVQNVNQETEEEVFTRHIWSVKPQRRILSRRSKFRTPVTQLWKMKKGGKQKIAVSLMMDRFMYHQPGEFSEYNARNIMRVFNSSDPLYASEYCNTKS